VWKRIQETYPPIFWTPHYGGHWVATRYREIERLIMEHGTFSNRETFIPKGVLPFMIPVQLDPPDHGLYRRLLMPAFSPERLAKATDRARSVAIEIIESLEPKAGAMPTIAFLTLINLPVEDYLYLRALSNEMFPNHPNSPQAWAKMSEYVRRHIELRRSEPCG